MAFRLISAAAIAWLAALVLFGAALRWNGAARRPPRPPSTSALARSLNPAQPGDRSWRWWVTRAHASQGALVVEADVVDLAESLAAARAIVEPVRARYTEVLVYLRQSDTKGRFAARRVQWTQAAGYVEMGLQDGP